MTFPRILPILLALCATFPSGLHAQTSQAQDRLITLMGERLALSHDVAWFKYEKGLPVRDPEREKVVIASAVKQGTAKGLPESWVRKFFTAQILASCIIQDELIHGWKNGQPVPGHPPEGLRLVVRPKLDRITSGMLDVMTGLGADPGGLGVQHYVKEALVRAGYPETVALIASAPFN